MGFSQGTDSIDRTDIPVLYELSKFFTREFFGIFREKSEDQILIDTTLMNPKARNIKEARLKREESEFYIIDSPFD